MDFLPVYTRGVYLKITLLDRTWKGEKSYYFGCM
jgi:hypothetical protein